MVFKRRNKLGFGRRLLHFVAPPKGWRRGVEYIGHRIRRLPDTPHRIAIGLACGTFVSFTPLFGLHFFLSMGLARILGGNILASLLGTFFGNPLTFPLIASFSLGFGRRILGHGLSGRDFGRVTDAFTEFFIGLWQSFWSIFGYGHAQWGKVMLFLEDILFPYLIGGMLPGIISAVAVYFVSRPVIVTLQARQRARALKIAAKKRTQRKSLSDAVSRKSYVGKKKKPVTGQGYNPMPPAKPLGHLRLGVNIDHVATVRNARGGPWPDPVRAAKAAEAAGADGITAHLREDRRHITDSDIDALVENLSVPLNLEMAATSEMQAIALRHKPHAVCIVPEKREERTTEGGLEVAREENHLAHFIAPLRDAGCRVSIFIAADRRQIEAAHRIGAPVIELHTGAYCEHDIAGDIAARDAELERLREMATFASSLGLEVHAGHGLTFGNVKPVAAFPEVMELNIGHFLVGEAIFTGLDGAIARMRTLMDEARAEAFGDQTA